MKKVIVSILMAIAILASICTPVSAYYSDYDNIKVWGTWHLSGYSYELTSTKETEFSRYHKMETKAVLESILNGEDIPLEVTTILESKSFKGFRGRFVVRMYDKKGVKIHEVISAWYGVKLFDSRQISQNFAVPASVGERTYSMTVTNQEE